MKHQYLGDSKDSFKWDYHHFLVEELGYSQLKVAWMMTPDDHGPDGKMSPERFPARPEILAFCNRLRSYREPSLLSELPPLQAQAIRSAFTNQITVLTEITAPRTSRLSNWNRLKFCSLTLTTDSSLNRAFQKNTSVTRRLKKSLMGRRRTR